MTATEITDVSENPCAAYSSTLKQIFSHVLEADDAPLNARLFAAAAFAYEADGFMYPGSPDFSEDRLAAEINRLADRVYERIWLEQFAGMDPDLELPMSMVQSFLLGRFDHFEPDFREKILEVWSFLTPESAEKNPGSFLRVEKKEGSSFVKCARMASAYKKRRSLVSDAFAPQVESGLCDFAKDFVKERSLENYRSLSSFAQDLVLHIMMHRFFIACDRDLADLEKDEKRAEDLINGIVCQTRAALEGQKTSMDDLEEMVFDQGLQELSHTGLLILF
jgi:hypothetical protein